VVLSLAPVSAEQGRTYYRQENYYSRDDSEEYSRWWGKGAETFGLSGEVNFTNFDRLLRGISPNGATITSSKNLPNVQISDAEKDPVLSAIKHNLKQNGMNKEVIDRVIAKINLDLGSQKPTVPRIKAITGRAIKELGNLQVSKPQLIIIRRIISKELTKIRAKQRRAAIDLTFSAPKSVSVQALLFKQQDLIDAHRRSVDIALKTIEQRFSHFRTGPKESRKTQLSGKLTVAQFEHDTSRAKDPDLHTHNVVINLLEIGKDGHGQAVYRAFHNDALYQNSKLGGVIYKNELARECIKLGYELVDYGNGAFDIKGFSRQQIEAFSKRRYQILEAGGTDAVKARQAVLVGRANKGPETSRDTLQIKWAQEAQALALTEIPRSPSAAVLPKRSLTEAINAAIQQVSERSTSFRQEDVELIVLQNNLGFFNSDKVRDAVGQQIGKTIFTSTKPGRYVSLYSLKIEQDYRRLAAQQLNNRTPLIPAHAAIDTVKKIADNTFKERARVMTQGQKRAILDSIQSRHGIIIWQGVAGAGKTDSLRPLVALLEQQGYEVKGFAQAASAAKQLSEGAGITATTLETMFVQDLKLQTPNDKPQFWIIDEAGFISSKDMVRLLEHQQKTGARIILTGDTRQLSAVESGNPFLDLQRNIFKSHVSKLNESVRQKDSKLKEAVAMMNEGRVSDGLKHLAGKMVEVDNQKRPQAIAAYYLSLQDSERDRSIVVARTNVERMEITQRIRDGLKSEGKLGAEAMLAIYNKLDIPRERLAVAAAVKEGHLLVPSKDIPSLGLKRNESYEVIARDTMFNRITLKAPSGQKPITVDLKLFRDHNFFEKGEITINEGDRLAWTRNQKGENRINNDMIKVMSISDGTARVRYDSGREEIIDLSKRQFLDHAIVITTNKSQGMSRWRNIVSVDAGKFKEALYVDVTRAIGDIAIFCSDKDQLFKQAEISAANSIATDLVADLNALRASLKDAYPSKSSPPPNESKPHLDPDSDPTPEPDKGLGPKDDGPDYGI
jgi:conjugative relaxase-like TrwC/TraI family protein